MYNISGRAPRGGLPGCRPPPPKSTFKTTQIFLDAVISSVLRDLLAFSLNKPLKSADDWYMGVLKILACIITGCVTLVWWGICSFVPVCVSKSYCTKDYYLPYENSGDQYPDCRTYELGLIAAQKWQRKKK